jgi:hypothetical protein
MTGRVARIHAVVNAKGFPAEAHKKGHRGAIDATRVVCVLVGDIKLSSWCGHAPTSSGELSGEEPSSVLIVVQALLFEVHYDVSVVGWESRGSVKCEHYAHRADK